jgi:hypothetical protein
MGNKPTITKLQNVDGGQPWRFLGIKGFVGPRLVRDVSYNITVITCDQS